MQDGSPPEFGLKQYKYVTFTITYFTDEPVLEQIQNRVTFANYTLVCPFINGEVILKESRKYPIQPDGSIKFDLQIPDKTATFTIKVCTF